MVGVLIAYNLEHVHGRFSTMWSTEEKVGMITRPPMFGKRFKVSLNRYVKHDIRFIFCVMSSRFQT